MSFGIPSNLDTAGARLPIGKVTGSLSLTPLPEQSPDIVSMRTVTVDNHVLSTLVILGDNGIAIFDKGKVDADHFRDGGSNLFTEIEWLVHGFVAGELSPEELSAVESWWFVLLVIPILLTAAIAGFPREMPADNRLECYQAD